MIHECVQVVALRLHSTTYGDGVDLEVSTMIMQKDPQDTIGRALILASDEEIVNPLRKCLSGVQLETDAACKALDAVAFCRQNQYQLVLIDKDLDDGMGSEEALWLLKPLVGNAGIAMIAGQIDPEEERSFTTHGVREWIHKPFSRERTPSEIDAALRSPGVQVRSGSFSPLRWLKDRFRVG